MAESLPEPPPFDSDEPVPSTCRGVRRGRSRAVEPVDEPTAEPSSRAGRGRAEAVAEVDVPTPSTAADWPAAEA